VGTKRTEYAYALSILDQAVGAIVNTLLRLDMMDNTYLIFASDNGGEPTQHTTQPYKYTTSQPHILSMHPTKTQWTHLSRNPLAYILWTSYPHNPHVCTNLINPSHPLNPPATHPFTQILRMLFRWGEKRSVTRHQRHTAGGGDESGCFCVQSYLTGWIRARDQLFTSHACKTSAAIILCLA
jgi:hypothetical protein